MTIDSTYELPSSDELDLNSNGSSNELNNNIATFELNINSVEVKTSKHSNKRSFFVKQRIEELQEERRLRKLDAGYYDD